MWNDRLWPMLKLCYPSAISAVLMAFAFPPYSIWGLSFIALVPFLLRLFTITTYFQAAIVSFSMACFIVFTGFYWVAFVAQSFGGLSWFVSKLVLVVFSCIGELQFLFFGLLSFAVLSVLRKNKFTGTSGDNAWIPRLLVILGLPVLYTGIDFMMPKIFPNTLGHALYGWLSLAQIVEWTGVPVLTFLILLTNVAIAIGSVERKAFFKPVMATIMLASFLIFILSAWGEKRLAQLTRIENSFSKSIKLSIIQANIGDVEKIASEKGGAGEGSRVAINRVLDAYKSLSIESKNRFKPDLIIWPETAYPLIYTHFSDPNANRSGSARDRFISELVEDLATPLVFGGYSTDGKKDYNSVFYVKPGGDLGGIYRKNILLAFGEYVPLGPMTGIVSEWFPMIANFGLGGGPVLMQYLNAKGEFFKFSPQICYEGINPEFTRTNARLGADFILNLTNDSWFGKSSEPWIHFWITAFRAIELRIPVVRATNTGFTAIIGMSGNLYGRTSLFSPVMFENELKLPSKEDVEKHGAALVPTFYYKYGEVFGKGIACLALVIIAWIIKKKMI